MFLVSCMAMKQSQHIPSPVKRTIIAIPRLRGWDMLQSYYASLQQIKERLMLHWAHHSFVLNSATQARPIEQPSLLRNGRPLSSNNQGGMGDRSVGGYDRLVSPKNRQIVYRPLVYCIQEVHCVYFHRQPHLVQYVRPAIHLFH